MNPLKSILFVDTSYVSFYRYFATIFWYKVSHKKETIPKDYDWYQNKEFMDKFSNMYMKSFDKIRKTYDIPYENMIFAKDCPRKDMEVETFLNTKQTVMLLIMIPIGKVVLFLSLRTKNFYISFKKNTILELWNVLLQKLMMLLLF